MGLGETGFEGADRIPPELVGEWRDGDDPAAYSAVFLLPNGRGAVLGVAPGTAIGAKIRAEYDFGRRALTITTLVPPEEGGSPPQTGRVRYDPASRRLIDLDGGRTLRRVGKEVPDWVTREIQSDSSAAIPGNSTGARR